ncbi:hypothetical protein [Roseovarius sp. EL26]|uniref:hypothetical protein n=1 Tax=Roseovarius sp. EL26 TaxID=2126672 RepID=UPI000EA256D6|nr:hypothetical protein [Roseovarius sp. EL26]
MKISVSRLNPFTTSTNKKSGTPETVNLKLPDLSEENLSDLYWVSVSRALRDRKCSSIYSLTSEYKGLAFPGNFDATIIEKIIRISENSDHRYEVVSKLNDILSHKIADAVVVDSSDFAELMLSNSEALKCIRLIGSGVCIFACKVLFFKPPELQVDDGISYWEPQQLMHQLHEAGFRRIQFMNLGCKVESWKVEGAPVSDLDLKEVDAGSEPEIKLLTVLCDNGYHDA